MSSSPDAGVNVNSGAHSDPTVPVRASFGKPGGLDDEKHTVGFFSLTLGQLLDFKHKLPKFSGETKIQGKPQKFFTS